MKNKKNYRLCGILLTTVAIVWILLNFSFSHTSNSYTGNGENFELWTLLSFYFGAIAVWLTSFVLLTPIALIVGFIFLLFQCPFWIRSRAQRKIFVIRNKAKFKTLCNTGHSIGTDAIFQTPVWKYGISFALLFIIVGLFWSIR